MPATVEALAQRVLHRLGLSLVAGSERDSLGAVVTLADVARQALQMAGANQAPATLNAGSVGLQDLAIRVLRRLGVISSDESPSGVDLAIGVEKVRDANQMAVAMGAASWSVEGVPEYAAEQVELIAANLAASYFGRPGDAELNARALGDLRTMALGGARGQSIAVEKAAQAYGMAVAAGVADWSSNETPAYMAPALVQMTASLLAPVYGKDAVPADAALQSMRRTLLSGPRGLAIAAEKVRDVHANLTARRRARWLLSDIPTAAEEPYVMMASTLMAPIAGLPAADGDWVGGERMITLITTLPSTGETLRVDYF